MTQVKNAWTALQDMQALHEKIGPAIDGYLGMLTDKSAEDPEPHNLVRVKAHTHYKTLDGSTVYVVAEVKPGACSLCGEVHPESSHSFMGLFGSIMGIGKGMQSPHEPYVGSDDDDFEDDDDDFEASATEAIGTGARTFNCLVLKGGHGMRDWPGEKPGSSFSVNEHGLVVGFNAKPSDGNKALYLGELAMASMSLLSRTTPK